MPQEKPSVAVSQGNRDKSEWNKSGFKKFDDAMVPTSHGQARVATYFNKDESRFAAGAADLLFFCSDYRVLVDAISEKLKALEALTFQRYIDVDYEQTHESRRYGHGSKGWYGDDKDKPVCGIRLEFDVYDISDPFEVAVYGGRKATSQARVWRRLWRNDRGEWVQEGDDETRYQGRDGGGVGGVGHLIPFTEERHQTLTSLKEGMASIAATLNGMFNSKSLASGQAALLLDGLETQKLLPAPPPEVSEKPKKKGRSR